MNSHASDIPLFVYNYLTNVYGSSYAEELNDEPLAWGYNSVNEQTCVVNNSDSNLNSIAAEINNRRTSKIKLITNSFSSESSGWTDLGFRLLNSKFVVKYPRVQIKTKNSLEFQFKSVIGLGKLIRTLRKNHSNFVNIIEADYKINNLNLLASKRLITIEIIYQSQPKTPFGCVFILAFQNITIIEFILSPAAYLDENVIVQLVRKTIKSKNLNRNKTLIILNSDTLKNIVSGNFNKINEIHYYEKHNVSNVQLPIPAIPQSAVLEEKLEFLNSINILKSHGLPKHNDLPKNWDSLAALSQIVNHPSIKKSSRILDAGGEYYSVLLHHLAIYGFINLYCINLAFTSSKKINNIRYQPGDITKTNFSDNTFAAITCLSVIEHGVDAEDFFNEMSRILKVNGILFISVDYWKTKINAGEKLSYGEPIKIFSEKEVTEVIETALRYSFTLATPIDLSCKQRVVACDGLKYTFLYLTFIKTMNHKLF